MSLVVMFHRSWPVVMLAAIKFCPSACPAPAGMIEAELTSMPVS